MSEERRRGFEDEGHEILKAGVERARGREGVESKIVTVQDLQERILGLASRDAYQNDEGLPSRRW